MLLPWLVACATGPTPPADTATSPGTATPAGLWTSGPIACPDPDAREADPLPVVDLGPGWGDLEPEAWDNPQHLQYGGGGVAIADFDGDGALDIFLPTMTTDRLFLGEGDGGFVEATERLPGGEAVSAGAVAGDVDGDGDLDLFVSVLHGPDRLLLNAGDATFVDGTAEAGVGGEAWDTLGAAFGDLDGDGVLDLAVAAHLESEALGDALLGEAPFPVPHPNRLYLGRGDGTFEDRTEALGNTVEPYSFVASWVDLDGDGWQDLRFVNDFGFEVVPDQALFNQGPPDHELAPPPAPTGLETALFGMGLGLGDLDGDGGVDLLETSWGDLVLLEQVAPDAWAETSLARGLVPEGDRVLGWGAMLADLDDDGLLDAWIAYGHLLMDAGYQVLLESTTGLRNPDRQPDALYLQQPDGTFLQVAEAWGTDDTSYGRGFMLADLDGDGWLDAVTRAVEGPPVARISRCGSAGWLEVGLAGPPPNPWGIGAVVAVEAGGRRWTGRVRAGGTSLLSSGPPEVHFGLGETDRVEVLEVTWPDGEVQRFEDLAARQRVVVLREPVGRPVP